MKFYLHTWAVLFLFTSSLSVQAETKYPKGFTWGVAFSAHQAEGNFGGGEFGDWWKFEHPPAGKKSPIGNGDNADIAVDHWHRYPEDIQLAKDLGTDSVRTSIAWEKVNPRPGEFNLAAIEHYQDVFKKMREAGIRPMIAFQHFTHPQWFHDRGGWLSPESPKWFLDYATFVVDHLGKYCDLWIVQNEPMMLVIMAYLNPLMPPNLGSPEAAFESAYNMGRAYRMVATMIHRKQGRTTDARGADGGLRGVGLANSLGYFEPANPNSAKDRYAVQLMADWMNWDLQRGIITGHLKFTFPHSNPARIWEKDMPARDLPADEFGPFFDWLGANYYSKSVVKYSSYKSNPIEFVSPPEQPADNWWPIYPQGMENILRQFAERFPGYPLVVTENGLADAKDRFRPAFIRDHLAAIDRALFGSERGPALDIRGYYHWSLFDNFEWLEGYKYRFGLVEIKYDQNLKRVTRPSFGVYRDEILKRK